jgi:hypothetical protein
MQTTSPSTPLSQFHSNIKGMFLFWVSFKNCSKNLIPYRTWVAKLQSKENNLEYLLLNNPKS